MDTEPDKFSEYIEGCSKRPLAAAADSMKVYNFMDVDETDSDSINGVIFQHVLSNSIQTNNFEEETRSNTKGKEKQNE
jgi:hypothetical protein